MTGNQVSTKLAALALALGLVLGGCALPGNIAPGTPGSQIVARLGQPTARYPLPNGGQRLQYSQEPMGTRVFNVDLDAQGRAVRAGQALDEALFARRIMPGQWTRQDVLREYGPPMSSMSAHNFDGQIWAWRYQDALGGRRLLYIDMDSNGIVRGYSTVDDELLYARNDF